MTEIKDQNEGQVFFDYTDESASGGYEAVIKVVGTGGGGGNAVATMFKEKVAGVEFIVANTDAQALRRSPVPCKLQIGKEITKGLGAGGRPEVGKAAAQEDAEVLRMKIEGADMVFITAGMGGGTGTGAAPVIAAIAKEMGALTVGVVTKPFNFEGKRRNQQALEGIAEFRKYVDTLITVPNQQLLAYVGKKKPATEAFNIADGILCRAVKGISELITVGGLVNLDFADVRTIMSARGMALMGTGEGKGENRAMEAAHNAINSPLLEDSSIEGAKSVLINITGGPEMTLAEIDEAASHITENADKDAEVIFGAVIDNDLTDVVRVTVIATGFKASSDVGRISDIRARESMQNQNRKDKIRSMISERIAVNSEATASGPRFVEQGQKGRSFFGLRQVRSEAVQVDEDLDIPTFIRKHAD
ncbi:MAG: cell division protein FtsZ [Nitrospinota bacterium]|nr:cell division protein FtsZ [Nitrospinota bacterium]MDH5677989.1 cell division protein FtsZ [Nitrospinota bacterium]MDH5755393.1 cell division protein FtsZ [Nitrospinota bacterium]